MQIIKQLLHSWLFNLSSVSFNHLLYEAMLCNNTMNIKTYKILTCHNTIHITHCILPSWSGMFHCIITIVTWGSFSLQTCSYEDQVQCTKYKPCSIQTTTYPPTHLPTTPPPYPPPYSPWLPSSSQTTSKSPSLKQNLDPGIPTFWNMHELIHPYIVVSPSSTRTKDSPPTVFSVQQGVILAPKHMYNILWDMLLFTPPPPLHYTYKYTILPAAYPVDTASTHSILLYILCSRVSHWSMSV